MLRISVVSGQQAGSLGARSLCVFMRIFVTLLRPLPLHLTPQHTHSPST